MDNPLIIRLYRVLNLVLRFVGKKRIEGIEQHLAQLFKALLTQLHIVDTCKLVRWSCDKLTKLLGGCYAEREVTLREAFILQRALQIHIVKEDILADVLRRACLCNRVVELSLNALVQLLALALNHRCADVLWAQEEQRWAHAECAACYDIRVATYLLEHINIEEVSRHA